MNGGGVMLALLLTRTMPTPDARETMPARVQEVLQYLASVAPSREERARAYRLHKPIDPSVFFGYLPSTGWRFRT